MNTFQAKLVFSIGKGFLALFASRAFRTTIYHSCRRVCAERVAFHVEAEINNHVILFVHFSFALSFVPSGVTRVHRSPALACLIDSHRRDNCTFLQFLVEGFTSAFELKHLLTGSVSMGNLLAACRQPPRLGVVMSGLSQGAPCMCSDVLVYHALHETLAMQLRAAFLATWRLCGFHLILCAFTA